MGIKSKQLARSGSFRKQRKEDALEFARILYRMYKQQKADGKIISGQKYANGSEK